MVYSGGHFIVICILVSGCFVSYSCGLVSAEQSEDNTTTLQKHLRYRIVVDTRKVSLPPKKSALSRDYLWGVLSGPCRWASTPCSG